MGTIFNLADTISRDLSKLAEKTTYQNHIEFLNDVRSAEVNGCVPQKLKPYAMNAVGSDEAQGGSNPDGGFLVPESLFPEVKATPLGGSQFDSGALTTKIPMDASVVYVNSRVDKDHTNSVSGGFRVYRKAETDTVATSKQTFEQIRLEPVSLMGLCYGSDELSSCSLPAFATLVRAGFDTEYLGRLNHDRINGTGVGEYLGVMNSGALITIAKTGGQTADTITDVNIKAMVARCWGYASAVWLVNQDAFAQVSGLAGFDERTFTLYSRPVVFDENCPTLGDLGDILLVNWSEYLEGMIGGVNFEQSIHVRFVNGENCFRFVVYSDGQPWWRVPMTPKNGAATLSPFVALQAR